MDTMTIQSSCLEIVPIYQSPQLTCPFLTFPSFQSRTINGWMRGQNERDCKWVGLQLQKNKRNQIHKAEAKHHRISHTARSVDTCTIKQARALVLLQSSCLEAVIHVLHNWDPQHKCVRKRERNYVVFPLLHSVLGPWWASQYGLTGALCRQEPGKQREPFISFILSPTTVVSPTLLLSFFSFLPLLLF